MMVSRLKAVAPEAAEPSKPKILIYGREGVGKTWFTLDFPGVYFMDTEGGANRRHYTDKLKAAGGVYMGPKEGAQDFETVIDQIKGLAQEKHNFKTVTIDSGTKLYNSAVADEAERLSKEGKKNEFSADRKPAEAYARRLVQWISRIDMSVIITAHQVDVWGNVNGTRESIGVGPDIWKKLPYELDLTINVVRVGPKILGKIGKSRLLGFKEGDTFDFTYDEFAVRYGKDVIEKEVRQLVLATEDQVAEVNHLLSVVKLPDGLLDKWFKAANADTWAEMDSDKIDRCINDLKKRITQ